MKNSKTVGLSVIAALAVIFSKVAVAQCTGTVTSITPNNGQHVTGTITYTNTGKVYNGGFFTITGQGVVGTTTDSDPSSVSAPLTFPPGETATYAVTAQYNSAALTTGQTYTDWGAVLDNFGNQIGYLSSTYVVGPSSHPIDPSPPGLD